MLWLIIPSIVYKTCIIFSNHTKLDQYLHQIFQLAYCQPLSAFTIHIIQVFTNIKRFTTLTFTYASIPNKPIITPAFINKFSTFKPAFIIILTLFIKHLHLTYTYMHKFHAKTQWVFISLWWVTYFNIHVLTTSGIHNLAYRLLISV